MGYAAQTWLLRDGPTGRGLARVRIHRRPTYSILVGLGRTQSPILAAVRLLRLCALSIFAAVAAVTPACAPAPVAPATPPPDATALTSALRVAFADEAHGSPESATQRYLDVLDAAATENPDPWQLAVTATALDALVFRSVGALGSITPDTALVYRTLDPSLTRSDTLGAEERRPSKKGDPSRDRSSIATRLASTFARARTPFVRGLIAEAMTELAEHRGNVDDASRWREASGCAREATVVGPLDWAPLTGVYSPDPLAAFDAKIAAEYPGPGGFAGALAPVIERGRGCAINLATSSSNPGVRDVVVDVIVPRAQRIGLMLRSASTATLRVGGTLVIDRPYDLGGADASRFAWAKVGAGTVRLVARVGLDQEGESVRIAAWDETGKPLQMRAPRAGEAATVHVEDAVAVPYPTPRTPTEELTVALAALALGDSHSAEYILAHDATAAAAPPDLALAYARAVEAARDITTVHRTERARTAYETVLGSWHDAWEAILGHAWLAGTRRGPGDARFAEIEDLTRLRALARYDSAPLLDAFELALDGRQHLWDRARPLLARLEQTLPHSALLAETRLVAFDRSPSDLVTYDCDTLPGEPRNRASLACYNALHAKGDLRGGVAELERLRAVLGGVDLFLSLTLRDALALKSHDDVERALRDMLPAEVTLSDVYALASLDPSRGTPGQETRERLQTIMTAAHDSPWAIAPLWRALRDDPTAAFAGVAESVVREDRAHPVLPGAATAVLRHTERYDVARSGAVHAVVFDLRRVSGTTDVEDNAQASAPQLVGRTALRILRKRILKHDGAVIEPDPNPGASQGHADLAQLEAGDVVEAIYEGWSVPLETGEIGIDTIDLLPPRTAVHEASVEVHLPTSLKVALWSHPIMGAALKQTDGDETVLRWSLKDHAARRVEDATPKMDRSVAVSLSTGRWSEVGRGLREAVAARFDRDPSVLAWAEGVVKEQHATTDRAKVVAVVAATGTAIKEGDPGDLSDLLYGHSSGPQSTTARGILIDHEGSRTWLIVRALHELGVACDLLVAENDPFSASADFPPHLGRFMHPLALAHVRGDGAASGAGNGLVDVLIDADVSGPPLPAGHISPELRGRQALHEDGTIAPLPDVSNSDERDEVDERLQVDARGDAKGTFTVVLRGRGAQDIAEVLERTVGDARRRALRNVVLAWVPFANVDTVELSSSEGSWQVAVRAGITIPGYAQPEGKSSAAGATWMLPGMDPVHDVYPRGTSSTLSATYASEGARESALAVSRTVQYHAHRVVELPSGASVARAPARLDVESAALTASRRSRVVSGATATTPVSIEDDFTLGVPTGTVSAAAYPGFALGAHRTDDAFLATTRVRMPVSAGVKAK